MPKTKTTTDRHLQDRTPVMMTKAWRDVLRKLACDEKRPMMWYLIDLIREQAQAKGIKCPPMPWEEPR